MVSSSKFPPGIVTRLELSNTFTDPEAASLERKDRILLGILRFIHYATSVNAILLSLMIIFRPSSPEMLTSVIDLYESINTGLKIILRVLITLLCIWVTNAAQKGVVLVAGLYVTSIFMVQNCLVSMRVVWK